MNIIQTKKIIPYLLTLIILVGLFNPIIQAHAQDTTAPPSQQTITVTSGTPPPQEMQLDTTPTAASTQLNTQLLPTTPLSTLPVTGTTPAATPATTTTTTTSNSAFQDIINGNFVCSNLTNFTVSGCLGQISYWILMVVPAYILWVAAYFFNVFAYVTLSGKLFSNAGFISTAWGVTRDLSNIFFILILLYIAIKLILGIDAHGTKKMIARVVIIALLINFSMFFTYVIIDSSNILALIFYNKINVGTIGPDGKTPILAPYESATGEKDVAGGLTGAFNPANKLDSTFFASASNINRIPDASNNIAAGSVVNATVTSNGSTPVSAGILFGIMILSGTVMLVAAYAFFVSGFSFLGRMIELFVLIIFSPFAFMSFTIPQLASVEYIGWNAWFKRLLSVSFMAAIFMFFMYFIFLVIQTNIFSSLADRSNANQGWMETLILIVIPALVILVLLMKATDYAKKGSGKFGEAIFTGAKMVGGLALGAATGGVAVMGTRTFGALAQRTLNDDNLRAQASGDKEHFAKLGVTDPKKMQEMQRKAQRQLASATKTANRSYDFRQTGIGKFAAKQSGMNIDRNFGIKAMSTEQLKGGAAANYKRKIEKNEEIRKSYEMTPETAVEHDRLAKIQQAQNDKKAETQNERAGQYEKDKNEAKGIAESKNIRFNEQVFKEHYQNGEDLRRHGLEKKVEAGSVDKVEAEHAKTSKDINNDRREAQAWHIDHPTSGQGERNERGEITEIKTGLRDFGRLFKEGMKEMVNNKKGLTTTALAGALTGGVGLVAAPLLGGTLHALKTIIKAKGLDHPATHKMFAPDPNLAGTLRKGTSASQKIVDILKDIEKTDGKVATEIKNAVAHPPTPPSAGNNNHGGDMHAPPLNH